MSEVCEDGLNLIRSDGKVTATIREHIDNQDVTLQMSGELSGDVALDLLDEMTALHLAGKRIIVDLKDATYLSASVAEVFLKMEQRVEQKDPNQTLRIINVSRDLFNRFKKIGLHQSLDIEVIQ